MVYLDNIKILVDRERGGNTGLFRITNRGIFLFWDYLHQGTGNENFD
jgi:hypothetical protein